MKVAVKQRVNITLPVLCRSRGLYPNSTHYPGGRSMKVHLN